MTIPMHDRAKLTQGRFPGYDVLSKRLSPSWNPKTREVIDRRLAVSREPTFFTAEEFRTLEAVAARIVPQPASRPPVPVAALVDDKLRRGHSDGYRQAGMPRDGEAWRQGLKALDAEANAAFGAPFHDLAGRLQDELLMQMEKGELSDAAWAGMPPAVFFKARLARDVVRAYYSHPTAWSEIGWGGPASPRGYVRMDFDKRDPWEAAEVHDGDIKTAGRKNRNV